jgi:hypothetical protein
LGADPSSNLGVLVQAANDWQPESQYFAATFKELQKRWIQGAPTDLYHALLAVPTKFGVASTEEFILGYRPPTGGSLSGKQTARLADWYDCLGEAFLLVSVDFPYDHQAADPHVKHMAGLAERIAAILIPTADAWQKLKPLPTEKDQAHQ